MAIPVIDMSKLDGEERAETMAKIANGCEEWGFFQVNRSLHDYPHRQKCSVLIVTCPCQSSLICLVGAPFERSGNVFFFWFVAVDKPWDSCGAP